ncbi:MAG: CRTAC1 family protein, partial [Verrucomicrobiales bacterium]|nr:CRTAC1 family protein [Verrucomicrobiales bacterium]
MQEFRRTVLPFGRGCWLVLLFLAGEAGAAESGPVPTWRWTDHVTHRVAPLSGAGSGRAGFTRLPGAQTGLTFTNRIAPSRHLTNQILLNGSGIACGDVDGDGREDVFLSGFDNPNGLYRNLGDWRFEDVAASAGVALPEADCTGAAFGDLDGDGDLDLVVNTLAQGTWLFRNDGQGRFERWSSELNVGRGAMTVAMADIDGDQDLDLYVANYRVRALMDMPTTRMTFKKVGSRTVVDTVQGRPASDPEFRDRFVVNEFGGIEENGEPDVLLRNDGGTNFVEVSWTEGAFLDETGAPLRETPRDWGLAAMFADVNADGRPDLYVCNDFQTPDRLWLNQGGGRFRLVDPLALRRTSLSSMAVDFADVNRDGLTDFFVAEMMSRDHGLRMRWVRENFPHRPVIGRYHDRPQLEQNTLQLGRADGGWSELAQLSGLEAAEWAWSCAFLDVDLDGWEDLLVVNGMERAARDLDVAERLKAQRAGRQPTAAEVFEARRQFPRLATPNLAFRNRGDLTFEEHSAGWGFDLPAVSQALALADLDGDGDLDVVVGNLNEEVALYRNESPAPRVAVTLRGQGANTHGIGARVEVMGGAVPSQAQEMRAGGRYLSGDQALRTFATGKAAKVGVRVHWPAGSVSQVEELPVNSRVEVHEPVHAAGTATWVKTGAAAPEATWFEDRTARLGHRHTEESFDDLAREPLLPGKLSQAGPGVAWVDLDQDGWDELVLGAGKGGRVQAWKAPKEAAGEWARVGTGTNGPALPRDAVGLLGLPGMTRGRQGVQVLVALSNYEDGAALGAAVAEWNPATGALAEVAPATESSTGPMAAGDIDGDGDLDLFVGGRVVPGRWPEAAASRFLRQEQGRWVSDVERSRVLQNAGMVTGAVFTDLDLDGDVDLALSTEWGPIRVYRQGEKGSWSEATSAMGLD